MASASNKLTALFVARATKLGKFNDGNSLYLQVAQVSERITKSWVLKYALHGRTREMGLGSSSLYSLSEARERARKYRQMVDQGIDPIEQRKAERAAGKAAAAKMMTFTEAAVGYFKDNRASWRSETHAKQWNTSLRDYVLPTLGALPVSAIK